MPSFPIILYPKPVEEFFQSVKAETPLIALPEPPALKNAALGSHHVKQFNHSTSLQLALAISFLLLAGAIFFSNLSFWLLVLLILCCSSTLVIVFQKLSKNQFYQKTVPEKESNQVKEYKKELGVYQKSLANHVKRQIQYNKSNEVHRNKLSTQLAQFLQLPSGYSTAQQGASEKQFKYYLDRYFFGHIHQGFKLTIPDSDLFYSTDFTYVNKSVNLYIDIEIDEPYYYKTKSPTHCCNDDKDKNRNAFFLNNGWIVIRFAEEQIVCYPNRCCKVIALVVAEISGEWELFNKFKDVPDLPLVKHWTIREARKMARAKYRDTYLRH
jgi:hypothetical protein